MESQAATDTADVVVSLVRHAAKNVELVLGLGRHELKREVRHCRAARPRAPSGIHRCEALRDKTLHAEEGCVLVPVVDRFDDALLLVAVGAVARQVFLVADEAPPVLEVERRGFAEARVLFVAVRAEAFPSLAAAAGLAGLAVATRLTLAFALALALAAALAVLEPAELADELAVLVVGVDQVELFGSLGLFLFRAVSGQLRRVHCMDSSFVAPPVEEDGRGLLQHEVFEVLGRLVDLGGPPQELFSELVWEPPAKVRLLLKVARVALATGLVVALKDLLEVGCALGDAFEVFDRLRVDLADDVPELLKLLRQTVVDDSHDTAPGVEAVAVRSLLEHRVRGAAEAAGQEAPDGRVERILLRLFHEVADGIVEGVLGNDLLVVLVGPLEEIFNGRDFADEVAAELALPSHAAFCSVVAELWCRHQFVIEELTPFPPVSGHEAEWASLQRLVDANWCFAPAWLFSRDAACSLDTRGSVGACVVARRPWVVPFGGVPLEAFGLLHEVLDVLAVAHAIASVGCTEAVGCARTASSELAWRVA